MATEQSVRVISLEELLKTIPPTEKVNTVKMSRDHAHECKCYGFSAKTFSTRVRRRELLTIGDPLAVIDGVSVDTASPMVAPDHKFVSKLKEALSVAPAATSTKKEYKDEPEKPLAVPALVTMQVINERTVRPVNLRVAFGF